MSGMTAAVMLDRARQVADDILFPSAMNVDAADQVPAWELDALASAGLYGLAGPRHGRAGMSTWPRSAM